MTLLSTGNRWYHARCIIDNTFVRVDIVAKDTASKDYILQHIVKVDAVVDEKEGITSKIEEESYLVSEINGDTTERKQLRQKHPRKLHPVNVRQHVIDSLNL